MTRKSAAFSLVAMFLCGVLAGCRSRDGSPEETFAAAKAAAAKNDFEAFCVYLTPEARDEFAALCVLILGNASQGVAVIHGEERARRVREEAAAVKRKHGLDRIKDFADAINFGLNEEYREETLRKVVQGIPDREAFIADVLEMGQRIDPEEAEKRLLTADARMQDVEIAGKTAEAVLLETRDGQVSSERIEFLRIEGRWKIASMPGITY